MDWIKLYTRKWIWGSGRQMTPDKRGIWVDLLALAAEAKLRDGTLRLDIGAPMKRDYIASVLMIERETLDAALAAFGADINADDGKPRVNIWKDGTIEITNWNKFQGKPEKRVAKETAIEKSKRTRQAKEDAVVALTRAVNDINIRLGGIRYIYEDGRIVDTKTGEYVTLEDLKEASND